MKIPNYIVNFCVFGNNDVKLIEFSPFLRCTSARLFRWDKNIDEMLNGNGKLTVREKEFEDLNLYIKEWERLISKKSEHFDECYIKDDSITGKINNYLSYINPKNVFNYFVPKFPNKKIFVVSVLKYGFYWNKKYITYDDIKNNKNKLLGKFRKSLHKCR